jgi:DNA-binding transcriptional LysR family regulator
LLPDQSDLDAEHGAQQLSLVAPSTTGLPRHRPITPTELAATGVLLLEEGWSCSDELAALIASADPATTPPRFGGIETVKRYVAAGLGLALLPTVTVADHSPTAGSSSCPRPATGLRSTCGSPSLRPDGDPPPSGPSTPS